MSREKRSFFERLTGAVRFDEEQNDTESSAISTNEDRKTWLEEEAEICYT